MIIIIVFNSIAQFYRYFKTVKEREQRIRKGKKEEHKEKEQAFAKCKDLPSCPASAMLNLNPRINFR